MASFHEEVEFKTLDGLILKGWLYPSRKGSPTIIMTPGFNCVKEMLLPEIAAQFQLAGITALIYDPRSIGQSGGAPRNEIDPFKQVEDYSEAMSFLATLPVVDPDRIGFWGMSFAGTVAASAAALDKRTKFVILVCPLANFTSPKKLPTVLLKCMRDRESQLKGNAPASLPVITANGGNPADMALAAPDEALKFVSNIENRGAANFVNRTTLQTYYKLAMWHPRSILKLVPPPPLMILIPENDEISPAAEQVALFADLPEPKRMHIAKGKRHLDILSGEGFPFLQKLQADFIHAALDGTLEEDVEEDNF